MFSLLQSKKFMALFPVDFLFISGKDIHQLEYPLSIFTFRHIISAFHGSAGSLLMCKDGTSALWTDGRYQKTTHILFAQQKHIKVFINKENNFEEHMQWIYKKHNETPSPAPLQSCNSPTLSIGICLWQYTEQQYSEIKTYANTYATTISHPTFHPISLVTMLRNITTILKKPLSSNIPFNFSRSSLQSLITYKIPSSKTPSHRSSKKTISYAEHHKNIVIYEKTYHKKITKKILDILKRKNASFFITANVHEIAYITGMRANIIPYLMVIPSFLCAERCFKNSSPSEKLSIFIFIPSTIIHHSITSTLERILHCSIHVKPYETMLSNTKTVFTSLFPKKQRKKLIYNDMCIPAKIIEIIQQNHTNITTEKIPSPFLILKSICPKEDIPSIKNIHKDDCIALLEAMTKIYNTLAKGVAINEKHAVQTIKKEKSHLEGFLQESFESISASGENGTFPHYNYKESKTPKPLSLSVPYLIDCGAHYSIYNRSNNIKTIASTDITRIFFFHSLLKKSNKAPLSLKKDYTAVLKAHISLATYTFDSKTPASELDAIARNTLYKIGKRKYHHGTGHGIGCGTDIHEGIQTIHPQSQCKRLYPHMLITNEPGFYPSEKSKKYWGIRLENVFILLKRYKKTLYLSPLSFFPFQNSLIMYSLLTNEEKSWLFWYQETCKSLLYKSLSPKAQIFFNALLS